MALLSPRHLRFLVLDEVLGSIVVNLAVNAAIAFGVVRTLASVPLWGVTSIAADTLGTAFVLPVLTAFFTGLLVRAQVVRRLLPPLPTASLRSAFSRRHWLQRGTLLGLAATAAVGAPVVAVFALCGPPALTPSAFIIFKATFAAALGAVVTPLLGWWALEEASGGGDKPNAESGR
jgi:hypothetical protein